jgi:prevent-host-death family protein
VREIAAGEARKRFGHLPKAAQRAPACVTGKGRAVGVMMSIRQYELLRGTAWEHLRSTMDALGAESAAAGLTEARLDALLADEV